MTQNSLQSIGAISMTTQVNLKKTHPLAASLRDFGVLPLVDLYGNILTGAGATRRLGTNFAKGFPLGGQDPTIIGTPVQNANGIWTSFSAANRLKLGSADTKSFTVQVIGRSTATQTGTDLWSPIGNYNGSTSSLALFANTATSFRLQASVVTPTAVGTGTITGNQLNITAVTTAAFAVGQHITMPGMVQDATITALGNGTGGIGTYTLSNSANTTSSGTVTGGAIAQTSVTITLPDVTAWRALSGVFTDGVSAKLTDFTSGTTLTSATGTALYPRSAPSTNNLDCGASSASNFQGAGDLIAYQFIPSALSAADEATAMNWLKQYATNRGITV